MQQYRVEFFENYLSATSASRKLKYVHHDFANDLAIDDDYIAAQTTVIEILATDKVKAGHLIRILRDDADYFFGLVTNVEPGEYTTKVSFKPFISIFDSDVLFNVLFQWRSDNNPGVTLEETLQTYINAYFVSNSDYLQDYPMTITIPAAGSRTVKWNMNIQPETEDEDYAVIGLYGTLIVRAMKEYGVAITITPNFSTGIIALSIGKVSGTKHIDADLKNVIVKTLKVNDRPTGINKLVVHNSLTFLNPITFYVHPDRSWDTTNSDRITPVSYGIRTVTPDGTYNNAEDDFMYAALSAAYDELSGLEFDNLIELECAPNDPLISPTTMKNGQKVAVHYQGGTYTSILTGKKISLETITLIFGSERISYTKKTSK